MANENLDESRVIQCEAAAQEETIVPKSANSDGKNSMAMSIIGGGLEFKIDTVIDPSSEALQLAAKLELALTLLQLSENRLADAMRMIGQLQEKLSRAEVTA